MQFAGFYEFYLAFSGLKLFPSEITNLDLLSKVLKGIIEESFLSLWYLLLNLNSE